MEHNITIVISWSRNNLWKETGLTNGAKGEVKYIIYEKGTKPPDLPLVVIVQVHQYTGPSFLSNVEKCVPIVPVTRTWYMNGKTCSRTMLPLNLAYAISIHKSQGMSLDKVMVNIGDREFSNGLTYTAITRVRRHEDLAFWPFKNYRRFSSIPTAKIFKMRLIQDEKEKISDASF